MYCASCGIALAGGVRVCAACGTPIAGAAAPGRIEITLESLAEEPTAAPAVLPEVRDVPEAPALPQHPALPELSEPAEPAERSGVTVGGVIDFVGDAIGILGKVLISLLWIGLGVAIAAAADDGAVVAGVVVVVVIYLAYLWVFDGSWLIY